MTPLIKMKPANVNIGNIPNCPKPPPTKSILTQKQEDNSKTTKAKIHHLAYKKLYFFNSYPKKIAITIPTSRFIE